MKLLKLKVMKRKVFYLSLLVIALAFSGINFAVNEINLDSNFNLGGLLSLAFAESEQGSGGCTITVMCCDCSLPNGGSVYCNIGCSGDVCQGSWMGSYVECDGISFYCDSPGGCDDACDPCFG